MSGKQKYAHTLLLALIGSTKSLQERTLSALYELAKEGDFERTGNKKIDSTLVKLMEDDDMADSIGDVYDSLEKKIKTHLSKG